jgi:heptosyltransferase-3
MTKTLVWHQGALGDLLLSLPSIYAIKRCSETESLHLVSRTDLAGLILKNGIADGLSSNEDALFAQLFGEGDLPGRLCEFLNEYHSVFVFARRRDPLFFGRIGKCIPYAFFIQTVPPYGKVIHVSDFQLQNVRAAGTGFESRMPSLEADIPPDLKPTKKTIAVHPGSGSRKKRWPLENYLELICRLAAPGEYDVRILLGPAEDEEIFRNVAERTGHRGDVMVVRNRPISLIAAVLQSSDLFIGNDSGIAHLASSLGVPTVALFGPTDHRLWGPAGQCVAVVRSGRSCSPCEEKRRHCCHPACLEEIETGSVIEEVEMLLKRAFRQ